jgi:PhzF family phenazine biosynthesis protein
VRLRIVDAFAEQPFSGNPAGVCLLGGTGWPAEAWMRAVAAELSLPMTAFAHPLPAGGEADWALRWFNPVIEDRLCGHATLAIAHVLAEDRGGAGSVRFATASGVLATHVDEDGAVTLDFPAAVPERADPPAGLAEAMGAEPLAVLSTGGLRDRLFLLAGEAGVRALAPDFAALAELSRREDIRGVTATAAADPGAAHDFVSRFFSPADGLPEDQVTGSAHTALAPFWSERLGRDELTGLQVSARTGVVRTTLAGDRVLIGGRAVTVLDGTLADPPG